MIPLIAGALTNVSILTPTDKVIAGSQVPVSLMGYDSYGNQVEQTTNTYKLSVSAGNILANGSSSSSVELQQFNNTDSYFADLGNVPEKAQQVTLSLDPINAAS